MKAIQEIKGYIKGLEEGESFTAKSLHHLASPDNTRQILTRMVAKGEIKRVARGVYVKPKHSSRLGVALPSAKEVAMLIAESTGETIGIHGAEAARQLQLTTQVPLRQVFYTTGYSRAMKIRNQTIQFKHVNPSKLIAPGTIAGTVISAFQYLGKDHVSQNTVKNIKDQLTQKEFETVLEEIKHMPAWMANVFYQYRKREFHA